MPPMPEANFWFPKRQLLDCGRDGGGGGPRFLFSRTPFHGSGDSLEGRREGSRPANFRRTGAFPQDLLSAPARALRYESTAPGHPECQPNLGQEGQNA